MTKKLDPKTYKLGLFRRVYTHADEVRASATQPMHQRKVKATMDCLRFCIDAILYGEKAPERWHWTEVVDAANLIETFIDLRYIDDPDDLHGAVHRALVKAGQRLLSKKVEQLRFDGIGATAIVEFADGLETMLQELSERKVIAAQRMTVKRCAAVLAGKGPEGATVQAI